MAKVFYAAKSYVEKNRVEYKSNRGGTMLEQLKGVVVDQISLEEALALMGFCRSLEAQFVTYGACQPRWLGENSKALDFQIKRMVRDELERKIQKTKSELASLATAEEKRAALKETLAALEGKLGS